MEMNLYPDIFNPHWDEGCHCMADSPNVSQRDQTDVFYFMKFSVKIFDKFPVRCIVYYHIRQVFIFNYVIIILGTC